MELMNLRNGLLIVLGVLLLIVGYNALVEKPAGKSRTVPDRIQGAWVTANPEYSDRYLEIGAEFITFGTGGVNSRRYEVTGFDETRDVEGRELNTVYFRDVDGSKFSREFYFTLKDGKQLVFKNQPQVVWLAE